MKKLTSLLTGIFLTTHLLAQNLEFNLNKGFPVGCSGANSLTDVTKKVTINITSDKATLSYASLNCTRTVECINYGPHVEKPQTVLLFSEKEKKGCFIEANEKIVLFSEKDGKYEIIAVGHTDKKQAKTVTIESENPVFTPLLGNMENILAKAKEQKRAVEMAKKMAKVPTTEFKDEYGISGMYYLSRIVNDDKNDKYISEVNLQFEVEAGNLKIHYNEGAI